MSRVWILGAPDPEMKAIEKILTTLGEDIRHATSNKRRVHPGSAYRADPIDDEELDEVIFVECDAPTYHRSKVVVIDHHREGDPGYGSNPRYFLSASSIGQVVSHLAKKGLVPAWKSSQYNVSPDEVGIGDLLQTGDDDSWAVVTGGKPNYPGEHVSFYARSIPEEIVLTAAADHCLRAAYAGECPKVTPEALGVWRAQSRATFQNRPVKDILADIEHTREILREASLLYEGSPACTALLDMRRDEPAPELPEAAARENVGYVSGPLRAPDGRSKYTCAGTSDQVKGWMETIAPSWGLVDIYGDPMRGFAGGYAK